MRQPLGIQLQMRDTALLARAREFLVTGPVEATNLISYVCQIPGAPKAVAERLAVALLGDAPGFACNARGQWMLAPGSVSIDAAASRTSSNLHELTYVVVDVETTGTCAYLGDRITEVAAVTVTGGEITQVFETLVNPERSIPPFITALTRITWGMVKSAPRFRQIASQLSSILEGQLFVAHNAPFDWRFLCAEMERASGARLLGERLCTVRMARTFLPQIRRRSLDSLARYFGVEITARHRAAGDAVATAHILVRLLREAEGRGCVTLEDIRLAMQPAPTKRWRRRRARPHSSDGDFSA